MNVWERCLQTAELVEAKRWPTIATGDVSLFGVAKRLTGTAMFAGSPSQGRNSAVAIQVLYIYIYTAQLQTKEVAPSINDWLN